MAGMLPAQTQVLIAGGGPFGLTLAIELGRRGVEITDREHQVIDPQEHRPSLAPRTMVR